MLEQGFLLALAVKVCIAACVVVSASLVAQRVSPFMAAMIATLPISAGPVIVFLAYEHGDAFLARSVVGSVAAVGANGLFFTGYAFAAQRHGFWVSVSAGLLAWVVYLSLLDVNGWSISQAFLTLTAIYAVCIPLTLRFRRVPQPAFRPRVWYDVPLRAFGVAAITAVVAVIGAKVGPGVSGYVALFPVVFTSLNFILHHTVGGRVAGAVVANSFEGLFGFAVALTFVHFTAVPLGAALSLSLGLLICLLWNLALIAIRNRKR